MDIPQVEEHSGLYPAHNATGPQEAGPSRSCIQEGHSVLFKLPNGDIKCFKIERNSTISFGRFGSLNSDLLLKQPYGLTYEILNKKLNVLPPRSMQEIEDNDATNELINDGLVVQPLTSVEIEALKQAGLHASEIIKRQIEQHANYSLKTEYSKEKYMKRKEAKFARTFTTIEPTIHNICEYWFNKDRNRIRDIRPDTLGQMMNLANIRPGGRYIAVDEASGMVVSGILERLGNQGGRIITVCDVESPPAYPIMSQLNFDEDVINSSVSSLNWATADEDHLPILPPTEPDAGDFRSDRQKKRINKRKNVVDSMFNTREELFAGEFEGLVIASEYDPYSIIKKLGRYLGGSASVVVHSPHLQVVTELQAKLRQVPQYLGPVVTEGWLRRYQVLPGRTHPMMNATGSGGFILHAIKIHDDPKANAVTLKRSRNKKRKAESTTPGPEPDVSDIKQESFQ